MASLVQPSSKITATTAPGKVFANRTELANHYKSDWHRYNLKRKENNLAPVEFSTFDARLKAAQALKAEREAAAARSGTEHLKGGDKEGRRKEIRDTKEMKAKKESGEGEEGEMDVPEEDFEIDPCDDLFNLSNQRCLTVEDNLERMSKLYGFFLPDSESCVDVEGLIGYCHEKVKLGHYCLYCQRIFTTAAGTIQHMRDAGHTKLRYEEGVDLEEFEVFYDFTEANKDYLDGELPDDMSDDEESDVYGAYEENIAKAGFKINEIGELVLPSGKIIGHRGLKRYYDQHYVEPDRREAIVAAKNNIAQKYGFDEYGEKGRVDIAVKAGLQIRGKSNPNKIQGRVGKGVLVSAGSSGGFTALSLYRFRRMAKVAKHQEDQARHYKMRKHNNTNRMDKKGNRLMNGVSVAHAKR